MSDTNTSTETDHFLVRRGRKSGSKKYQQPGYYAIVRAPLGWDQTRPLSAACLATDGAEVVWSRDFCDARHSGPRSDHGQALAEARERLERMRSTWQHGVVR